MYKCFTEIACLLHACVCLCVYVLMVCVGCRGVKLYIPVESFNGPCELFKCCHIERDYAI